MVINAVGRNNSKISKPPKNLGEKIGSVSVKLSKNVAWFGEIPKIWENYIDLLLNNP